uniref:tyrosine-type recombinase/integrase n=1 Tax=[Ruminococcus] torques TaxID=33039 RepID=UPI00402A91E8
MAKAKYTRGADGYFKTNVWDGTYKSDGRKHYIPLRSKKSSGDLEKKKKEYEEAIKNRTQIRQNDISFLDYAREWKRVYKGNKEHNTREMYDNVIEKHLSVLDMVKLHDVDRIHLQMILNRAKGKERTQELIRLVFFQILRSAVADRLFSTDVYEMIKANTPAIDYKAPEKRPLTAAEKTAVFKAQYKYESDQAFVYLLYGCGFRREECIALTVFDFNFADQTVSVNRAHEFVHGRPRQKDPKTWNGFRTLPLPSKIYPTIKAYVETLKASGKTYLFTTQRGDPASLSCYRRMWERIIDAMQSASKDPITGLTAHIFRHNYCTMLCYQIPRISIKRIAQLLGDKERMVLDVYNHVVMEREDAAGAVDAAINF